ncbi:MAG: polymer-forming cytoskeletal protein [Anaerolineae bacterium]
MFGKEKISDRFENVIGRTADLDGHLKCQGGVRVEGRFSGFIETEGNVVVGQDAQVAADIRGKDILVSGMVQGNIAALGQLAILSTGQVWGDIEVGSFLIEDGGIFSGKSVIRDVPEPPLSTLPSDPARSGKKTKGRPERNP